MAKFDKYIKGLPYRSIEEGFSGAKVRDYGNYILKIQKTTNESITEIRHFKKYKDLVPIPTLIDYEVSNDVTYILMTKMKGVNLSSAINQVHEFLLMDILIEGIKLLWEKSSLFVQKSSLDEKLKQALLNIQTNQVNVQDFDEDTTIEFKTPEQVYQYLMNHKPQEDLVLSHGDYCLPNIFMDNNKLSGFIDIARMGVMDKYQDIALCYRSLIQNYRGKFRQNFSKDLDLSYFFGRLGIKPDFQKIKYFLLLDELF